jgi:hypothetical protein
MGMHRETRDLPHTGSREREEAAKCACLASAPKNFFGSVSIPAFMAHRILAVLDSWASEFELRGLL